MERVFAALIFAALLFAELIFAALLFAVRVNSNSADNPFP